LLGLVQKTSNLHKVSNTYWNLREKNKNVGS
jgi:hypothetical protein